MNVYYSYYIYEYTYSWEFPCGSAGEESVCNERDLGLIPGMGWSPGEGKGYPLQYSGLENSMDCTVHGVANSQTQLSDFHSYIFLEIVYNETFLSYDMHECPVTSVVSNSLWPLCTVARQVSLSSTISQSLLKIMSIESVILSNHLILCGPLLLLPSIFPSIRVILC